jgi:anti-sigma factor RsiW
MHEVVVNELENHLAGSASPTFHGHLATCQECRAEVEAIESVSGALSELRSVTDDVPEPSPYFYQHVVLGIAEQGNRTSWSVLSPGAAFFRRIAFASLLVLAGLGSYLVTREEASAGTDAAAIMAQHDGTIVHADSSDRDFMLVTLASYKE